MAIASMLPALTQITSSIASAAGYGFTRVLTFTGSFNDRTSLLLAPAQEQEQEQEPTSPPSVAQEASCAQVAFDIEAATPATTLPEGSGAAAAAGGQGQEESPTGQDAESKRVAKSVQTVCLFGASSSLLLFVNNKKADAAPPVSLNSVNLAFICLGLFASLGLSMFTIVARPGVAAVARVQKWGMVMALAFVLAAFTLRMIIIMLYPKTSTTGPY